MNTLIKGKAVNFDNEYLHVKLQDDRIISTPMHWYKELVEATIKQLSNYKFICQNTGIEWPDLDYHLNIESMFLSQHMNEFKLAA